VPVERALRGVPGFYAGGLDEVQLALDRELLLNLVKPLGELLDQPVGGLCGLLAPGTDLPDQQNEPPVKNVVQVTIPPCTLTGTTLICLA
jgi:hypothetical protein